MRTTWTGQASAANGSRCRYMEFLRLRDQPGIIGGQADAPHAHHTSQARRSGHQFGPIKNRLTQHGKHAIKRSQVNRQTAHQDAIFGSGSCIKTRPGFCACCQRTSEYRIWTLPISTSAGSRSFNPLSCSISASI